MAREKNEVYDTIIIGAGPAGMTAAIYAIRYQLKVLIISKDVGGVSNLAHKIENWPGIVSITGPDLMQNFKIHVEALGVKIIQEEVVKLTEGFEVSTSGGKTFKSKTLILALGTVRRKLNVPGEDEFIGKGVSYCFTCLPPDESIIVNSSIKKIKDINPLTKVLTIDGTYKEISGFTKRQYKGTLVSIRPRFFNEPTFLTPDHLVYSLKVTKDYYSKYLGFSKPEWVSAGNLTKDDCVLYPILKEIKNIEEIKLSDFIEVKKEGEMILPFIQTHTSNKIPDKIKIDDDFMRLAGYYVSEGTASRNILLFSFKKDEDTYINDVKNILKNKFGLEPKIKYEKNVCRIEIYSKVICDFLKSQFEHYAHKKRIPHWIVLLPPKKQRELIKGLWRGDGCIREKDFCYATSSRELAYQIRDILLRLGIIPSIQIRKKESLNRSINRIEGRLVGFNHDKYHITVGGQFLMNISNVLGVHHPKLKNRNRKCNHAWLNDKFAILPIRDINKIDYEGQVLNVAVPDNQTYVAKNFIVHNCDGPMFRDKIVCVVGGSNSAAMAALLLVDYAKKVYIIYRKEALRADPVLVERVNKNKKIQALYNTEITKILGTKFVEKIVLNNGKEMPMEGIFIEVGGIPSTDLAKELGVKLDEHSSIIVDGNMQTNIQGVYAAGDITNTLLDQVVTACSDGAKATYSVFNYLKQKPA